MRRGRFPPPLSLSSSVLFSVLLLLGRFCNGTYRPPGGGFGIPGENAEFDYVVVGGGTAGLPLATRLAQDGRFSVAVLEAGGFCEIDNGNRSIVPGYDLYSTATTLDGVNPLIDWSFMTEPRINGRPLHYIRGKCFGGSSARNYMTYQRPDIGSMQAWAEAVDDESWTWANVLPYFKKSTTLKKPEMQHRRTDAKPVYDLSMFGDGPLQVGFANYVFPGAQSFTQALKELGVPAGNGFASGELNGQGFAPMTLDTATQERSTSETAYGPLARMAEKLTRYPNAFVKKVIFDQEKRATGVMVETAGMQYTIKASKEIILSAGAIQSPQLLMVSGVGPAETLKKIGIPVIQALPGVGQNLMDHPIFAMSFPTDEESLGAYLGNPAKLAEAIREYNEHRTGYLTSSGIDAIIFESLRATDGLSKQALAHLAEFPPGSPDVQFVLFPVWYGEQIGSNPPDAGNYGSIISTLLRPVSRGFVAIKSSDMADHPVINLGTLAHPVDQEMAAQAMRRIREIVSTSAFRAAQRDDGVFFPDHGIISDEELVKIAIEQGDVLSHAAATCKMGTLDDPMAVVDSKARVIGVQNLRVVDLSAVPFLPPGQPQGLVYMLAEKLADDILREADTPEERKNSHDEL